MTPDANATFGQDLGAAFFGVVVGWYAYYVNRYRKADVQLGDLATLIAVLGGAGILHLFPAGTDLFAAYGIGVAIGFFTYFIVLFVLVSRSRNFNYDWFLDGRRRNPDADSSIPGDVAPTVRAMGDGAMARSTRRIEDRPMADS
jgi:hypothetical protein